MAVLPIDGNQSIATINDESSAFSFERILTVIPLALSINEK